MTWITTETATKRLPLKELLVTVAQSPSACATPSQLVNDHMWPTTPSEAFRSPRDYRCPGDSTVPVAGLAFAGGSVRVLKRMSTIAFFPNCTSAPRAIRAE